MHLKKLTCPGTSRIHFTLAKGRQHGPTDRVGSWELWWDLIFYSQLHHWPGIYSLLHLGASLPSSVKRGCCYLLSLKILWDSWQTEAILELTSILIYYFFMYNLRYKTKHARFLWKASNLGIIWVHSFPKLMVSPLRSHRANTVRKESGGEGDVGGAVFLWVEMILSPVI